MHWQYILDLGSNTAKLYKRNSHGAILNITNDSWCLLESDAPESEISKTIHRLAHQVLPIKTCAIGTEVFRRSPKLALAASAICRTHRIAFKVIGQEEEAGLIRQACIRDGIPNTHHIVNVGGGSIQIVHPGCNQVTLLPFGVVDLSRKYNLWNQPHLRKINEAICWVSNALPKFIGSFTYTGGEMSYLMNVGAKLEQDGMCHMSEFIRISAMLSRLTASELETFSPFDPRWMNGAIASNCIVLALLRTYRCDRFLPSDVNISEGFLEEIFIQ